MKLKTLYSIFFALILLVMPVYAYTISGFVKDSDTIIAINGAAVDIEDLGGVLIDSATTNSNGFYTITIADTPGVYVAKASATGYLEQSKPFYNDINQDIDFSLKFTGGVVSCTDNDGDGYGDQGTDLSQCSGSTTLEDCNDNNANVYPGAPELCDSVDNQCSGDSGYGTIDEGCGSGGTSGGGGGGGGGAGPSCAFNLYDLSKENNVLTRNGCTSKFEFNNIEYILKISDVTVTNLTAELMNKENSENVILDSGVIDLYKSGRVSLNNYNDLLIVYNNLKFGEINLTISAVEKEKIFASTPVKEEPKQEVKKEVKETIKKTEEVTGAAVVEVKREFGNLAGIFIMLGVIVVILVGYFLIVKVFRG